MRRACTADRRSTGRRAVGTVAHRATRVRVNSQRLRRRARRRGARLRGGIVPAAVGGSGVAVYVGGATATFEDLADKIASRLPMFIALVVSLGVLLLMAVFRSLWVPLVSAVFNLLSILAAGAIMTAVFLGFVTDSDVVVKTIGLGLASAILTDVLIARMVVAPAVMALLGDRAWGLPRWLDRILPKPSLEGEEQRPLIPA